MEFAATENAKVCTSVRSRYFAVEIATLRNRPRRGCPGSAPAAFAGDGDREATPAVMGSATSPPLILSKGKMCLFPPQKPTSPYVRYRSLYPVKASNIFIRVPSLIFLAKRFNTAYYLWLLMNRCIPGHEFVRQVDVLSRAVEISAEGPGSRSSRRIFSTRRRTRGVFCFGAKFLRHRRRNQVSPDFLRGRSVRFFVRSNNLEFRETYS